MSRYAFALAGPADDAQLRARMAADRMEGAIAVSFRREPSYFAGCRIQGDSTQVIKCTDTASGAIVGMGCRSTATAWVDGEPRRIGHLADLRGAPEVRRGTLLARGFRLLRALHDADPVPLYTTVIYEGNEPALRALTGARAGLPVYLDWGRLLTPALRLDRRVTAANLPGVELERGAPATLPEIVEFLDRWQRTKQFAPVYRAADFPHGRFAGLEPGAFFVARRHGRIVGTLAAWDQGRLRQTHVERYPPWLAAARPFVNALARFTSLKALPPPGGEIRYVYLSCVVTEENDVGIFRHLLRASLAVLERGRWQFAIAGLHEADPLAPALLELRHIPAAGRLFVVHFGGQPPAIDPVGRRTPYVEAGCL